MRFCGTTRPAPRPRNIVDGGGAQGEAMKANGCINMDQKDAGAHTASLETD